MGAEPGNQVCGFHDIKPSAFGQVDNLRDSASNFGKQTEVFDGIDINTTARFGKGGLLAGGVSFGRTVTDACEIATRHPEVTATMTTPTSFTTGPSFSTQFCRLTLPFLDQAQVKLNGVYPLPWDLQVSAVFQNLAGFLLQATRTYTNAEIAPSLGRNVGQCRGSATCTGTVTVPLVQPGTMYDERSNQLDVRLTKIVRFGNARLQGMFDVYNVFNASSVLASVNTYGSSWRRPTSIMGGLLFKFGAQLDF